MSEVEVGGRRVVLPTPHLDAARAAGVQTQVDRLVSVLGEQKVEQLLKEFRRRFLRSSFEPDLPEATRGRAAYKAIVTDMVAVLISQGGRA